MGGSPEGSETEARCAGCHTGCVHCAWPAVDRWISNGAPHHELHLYTAAFRQGGHDALMAFQPKR